MKDKITIKGAREHNLKNVDLELPRNKLVCFTGLSGSGKSSLAFDTIFAEGQRRYIESLSAYARQFLGQMQKPDVDEIEGLSPAISIDQKAHSRNPRSTVATVTEIYDYLRVLFARIGVARCPKCEQSISKLSIDEITDHVLHTIGNPLQLPLGKGEGRNGKMLTVMAPVVRGRKGEYYQLLYDFYNAGFAKVRINGQMHKLSDKIKLSRYKKHEIEIVIDSIPATTLINPNKDQRQRLTEALEIAVDRSEGLVCIQHPTKKEQLYSTEFSCAECGFSFPEIEPRLFSFNSPYGACQSCDGLGTIELFSEDECEVCEGKRLRTEALNVFVNGKNIAEFVGMSVKQATEFVLDIELSDRQKEIASTVLKEIENRLAFMLDVGLHYLTLNRRAGTLSGGEAQRIRLASQIGSRLVGALYVLDEPTIGLHQRDNDQLIATLKNLRDLGNTVIVVEHDEDTIRNSDVMVEIGPGAGVHGGEIVAVGEVPEIFNDKKSTTAAYLRGDRKIEIPKERRKVGRDRLKIVGAKANNLKNLNVEIPLRRLVCVTGVSGSGKSSLMHEVMYKSIAKKLYKSKATPGEHKAVMGVEYIDKLILIDQSAIGRTSRSNPATYTGAWGPIRELYTATEEARFRGYKPGRFSFNVKGARGGRCSNCEGLGEIGIEMHFLPTVYVQCDVCKGKRFNRETLEVKWNDKDIYQVLDMTIEDGLEFFKDIPTVFEKFKMLNEVGLGYLKIGQSSNTLSGGEAQRVKLASELAKRQTGRTMYLLDEPTTGLHFEDVKQLLEVLHRLVARGNTVCVIEHNLDVIKTADWVIDLGPEGGDEGGTIVAEGTPEDIARKTASYTGKYLRKVL
ncbi:excinuclease ABC subunit UvrA [Candidatus Uhrbacteria bacterium]|jgi:excinuclease ABC subunit A|nr:excinuclease ABC subunit UvrA [Candidatus Uhrbacteria bacterium]MBT7716976.1 excinuclease ABC subunit UvrA [Candidatus Uhrbacteria bacterium]